MIQRTGALLGFGNVAAHGHAPAWQRRQDTRITAIADLSPERRALAGRQFPHARVYDDPSLLLAREQLDFVDIATPPAQHAPLIVRAAAAGCHVVCEKPLVTSLDDLHRAVRAVREAGAILFTVHNWKYAPQFIEALRVLDAGTVGAVRRVRLEVERSGQSVTVGTPWRTNAAQAGGGILFDHGWHNFYLLLALARERPLRVRAVVERRTGQPGDVEDTARCVVEFPSLTGEIHLTWAGTRRRTHWHIAGEGGEVDIEDDQLRLRGPSGPRAQTFPEALSAGSHHPDWFDRLIDDFFAELEGRHPRGANLREAALCLTLIERAYASAATGVPLDLPAETLPPRAPVAGRAVPSAHG